MTTRPGYVWDATASEWVEIGQAAVVSPFKYQTSQPSSPATGDIWIDSDDEVPSVDSTLYYRWTKTMSGGETSLSGTDNNSLALKYTPGYESVFINGVLQVRGSDYVATTGTTVTGLTALTASDVVMVESIVAYSVGDTYTQSQISSLLDAKSPVSTTGLVLISTSTFSAVSSVSLDNVFSAAYENYKILVSMTGTTSQQANIRFRVGGVDASGANYNYGRVAVVASAIAGSTSTSQSEGGVGNFANAERSFITMDVFNPFLAVNTQYASSSNQRQQSNFAVYNYSGSHNVDTSYTGFTLSAATGNITGTIKVYGYK